MNESAKVGAVHVALQNGAPADITDYMWFEAEAHGETFDNVQFDDGTYISLVHTHISTYGETAIGWDVQTRRAVFGFRPAKR